MNGSSHLIVRPVRHRCAFWRLPGLFRDAPATGLLDSALADPGLGRFSFLVPRPDSLFTAKRDRAGGAAMTLDERPGDIATPLRWTDDPFEALRRRHADRAAPDTIDLPPEAAEIPFLGGAILCLGYEAGHVLEDLPDTCEDPDPLPDMIAMFSDTVLAHVHATGRTWCAVTGRGADPDRARRSAEARYARMAADLERYVPPPEPEPVSPPAAGGVETRDSLDRAAYLAAVSRIKADIREGRIFEACMSRQIEAELRASPDDFYRELRRINPAPFAAFLRLPGFAVAGSSPERFLRLDRDGVIESRPIKGTRPRGADPAEDDRLRRDLAASLKDRAENLMIVDLVRNDIGRVSEFGSVHVPELTIIEKYATVWQLVSTIRGRMSAGLDAIDALRACFPGGSMTGAPKIEAMRVIDELEPVTRQIYSGSIGYLDDRGGMDLNIVIRTAVIRGDRCRFGTGGAVVHDSDPADEYQESVDKARALIEAVGAANARRDRERRGPE